MPDNPHLLVATFPRSAWSFPFQALAKQANKLEQDLLAESSLEHGALRELLGTDEPPKPLLLAIEAGARVLEIATQSRSHTKTLVLFEDPRTILSSLERRDDPRQRLETWSSAAHAVISAHRAAPTSVIIISADEARESPEAFVRFAAALHPECWNLRAPASAIDPVRHVLAHAELATLPGALASACELEASCRDFGAAVTHSLNELRLTAAWDEWDRVTKGLTASLGESSQKSQEINALRAESRTLRETARLARENAASTVALEGSLKETKGENELLLSQLHQVQEELERHFVENRQLAPLREEVRALRETASKAELKTVAFGEVEISLKETKEENEMLLLQLHQVQEELEHYFLQNRELQRRPAAVSLPPERPRLQAGAVRIGAVANTPPHLHLDFLLEEAAMGPLALGSVALRLVEHHGRPGLLIFASPGSGPLPLMHWRSNGEEAGREFMLVVPQDEEGRNFLLAATTTDLCFCEDAAALSMAALNGDAGRTFSDARRWSDVASAFLDRCRDIPVRLHYDDVLPEPLDDGDLRFRVVHASVPGRHVAELDFVWRASSFVFRAKRGSAQPLSHWPPGQDGSPGETVVFDFHRGHGASEPWTGLSGTDRLFLLQIVSELPNFLYHLEQKHPDFQSNKTALLRTAEAMKKRARALLYPSTKWQRLKKAVL
jgi:hypothetical protein